MTIHSPRITSLALSKASLILAALLPGVATNFAGEALQRNSALAPALEKAPDRNPLSFADGLFTFDLQERFRWEIRENNFDFNDSAHALTDDNWFLQRFRIGLMIKPTNWLKIYAQGQDAREINSDRPDFPGVQGAEGDDSFDLRQGYVELGDPSEFPLTLKVGRQILAYGDERLIGVSDWNNISRTFDAIRLRWEEKSWSLDAFVSSVVVPTRGQYNQSDFLNGNETGREQVFSGLYLTTTALPFQTTDLYAFHLHENQNPRYLPAARGDTNFATFGFRVKSTPGFFATTPPPSPPADGKSAIDGKSEPNPVPAVHKPVGFDYEAEAAFQTGDLRGLDLTAWAVHGGLGYTFDVAWLPRLGVAYNYATGDHDPADGDAETFQNLFPTNHKFYGQMDAFSWQNMHDLEVSVKAKLAKSVSVKAEFHAFWLASTDDVWYRSNGTTAVRPLTAAARQADNFAGMEVDLLVQWKAAEHLEFEAGYSHFFAGDYLSDTGPSDGADFGYLQTKISF